MSDDEESNWWKWLLAGLVTTGTVALYYYGKSEMVKELFLDVQKQLSREKILSSSLNKTLQMVK